MTTTLTSGIDHSSFDASPRAWRDESRDISDASWELIRSAKALGDGASGATLRAWAVALVFDGMERVFASSVEPIAAVDVMLRRASDLFQAALRSEIGLLNGMRQAVEPVLQEGEEAEITGQHYGALFSQFDARAYWNESVHLLSTRLERNQIDLPRLNEQSVLDAGCGGGRYTVAWKLLGARRVVGVDISDTGLADARARVDAAGIDGVDFRRASVLALPVEDDSADIVFSNGVLHHTTNWRRGVYELLRVLRPGGFGWLYVIEKPGGLFWDLIELLRAITHRDQREQARQALQLLGLPGNRIFYMLDHVMAPINVRLTPSEVEETLVDAGAAGIRRLERGADFDRVERIYRQEPYAAIKYGVGENRFVFTKA